MSLFNTDCYRAKLYSVASPEYFENHLVKHSVIFVLQKAAGWWAEAKADAATCHLHPAINTAINLVCFPVFLNLGFCAVIAEAENKCARSRHEMPICLLCITLAFLAAEGLLQKQMPKYMWSCCCLLLCKPIHVTEPLFLWLFYHRVWSETFRITFFL